MSPIVHSMQTKTLYFKEQILSSLTARQKTILLIAALALSCLATIYLYTRCCFRAAIKNAPAEAKDKPVIETPEQRSEKAFLRFFDLLRGGINASLSAQLKGALDGILPEHINRTTSLKDGMMGREQTLLLQAIMRIGNPHLRLEIVEELLKRGANPLNEGFYYVPVYPLKEAEKTNDPQLIEVIKRAIDEINAANQEG